MERSEILDMMTALQLAGMRAAYDEIVTSGVKRQQGVEKVIGALLKAEIAAKQARSIQSKNDRAKCSLLHSRFPQPVATQAASPLVTMVSRPKSWSNFRSNSGVNSWTVSCSVPCSGSGTVSGANWRDVLGGGDGSVAEGVAPGVASVDFTSGTTVDCTGSSPVGFAGSGEPRFHQRDVGSLVTAMRVGFRFGEILGRSTVKGTIEPRRGACKRQRTVSRLAVNAGPEPSCVVRRRVGDGVHHLGFGLLLGHLGQRLPEGRQRLVVGRVGVPRDLHVGAVGEHGLAPGWTKRPLGEVGPRLNDLRHGDTTLPMGARHPSRSKPQTWLAYRIRGAKASMLGQVTAATMDEAIAVAAQEYRVPPSRILVQQVGNA